MLQQEDNTTLNLKLWTNRKENPFFREDDEIFIYFISNKDVFLKLDYFMSDGTVAHLIPNIISEYRTIKSGKLYILGGKDSKLNLVASSPYGTEEIRALISEKPFTSDIQRIQSVEDSAEYIKLISNYIMNTHSNNKLVTVSFELISTP